MIAQTMPQALRRDLGARGPPFGDAWHDPVHLIRRRSLVAADLVQVRDDATVAPGARCDIRPDRKEDSPVDSFMDWFWLMLWWFAFVMYLMVLFHIIGDLFRDRDLNGWWKALWVVALIVVPFFSALVYLIARGRGMAERQLARASAARAETDAYIRATAGGSTAASQITEAKALYDAGVIDDREFGALKEKALG